MSESFTYIIRSINKENTDDLDRSCTIKLSSPSNKYKYYDAEVSGFYLSLKENAVDVHTNGIVELRSEYGLDITNGSDTKTHSLKTLAFCVTNNCLPQTGHTFRVANFENKSVNFSIYGDDGVTLLNYNSNAVVTPYNRPWTLVLKLTGVE